MTAAVRRFWEMLPFRVTSTVGMVVCRAEERHRLRVHWRCGVWRYRELMSGEAMAMPRARQRVFQRRLRRCARRARVADIEELLDSGWRERLVACWLIAVGRRAELRPRLARDLREPEPSADLFGHTLALVCLATEQDARILRDYLDMALKIPGRSRRHCRGGAMTALLYLDEVLGTTYAAPLLEPDGQYTRWAASDAVSLEEPASSMEELRALADVVAFTRGRDPGVRARLGEGRHEYSRPD